MTLRRRTYVDNSLCFVELLSNINRLFEKLLGDEASPRE